jgi:hypothetical protein
MTSLAMWSEEVLVIELVKSERGLGFSILDYQDPMNKDETVIVIRSLVPGGVAQQDGRLIPGDRLMYVNDVNLEHASLDDAVQALKGAARGIVRIGVAKPLPVPDNVGGPGGNIMEGNDDDTTTGNTSATHTTTGSTPKKGGGGGGAADDEDRTEVEGSELDARQEEEDVETKIPDLPDDDAIPPPLPTRCVYLKFLS